MKAIERLGDILKGDHEKIKNYFMVNGYNKLSIDAINLGLSLLNNFGSPENVKIANELKTYMHKDVLLVDLLRLRELVNANEK